MVISVCSIRPPPLLAYWKILVDGAQRCDDVIFGGAPATLGVVMQIINHGTQIITFITHRHIILYLRTDSRLQETLLSPIQVVDFRNFI